MRVPLWERTPGALVDLLNAGSPVSLADLYTFTLPGGAVYRWSSSDIAITVAGQTWTLGPGITRDRLRWVVGVQVDSATVTITDNRATLINGNSLMGFIRAGGLIGATVQIDRAFWGIGDTSPVGTLLWFPGRVGEVPMVSRHEAQIVLKSPTELLDVQIPRELYQPGCRNTLYGPRCGVVRSAFTVAGVTTTATTAARTTFGTGLVYPDSWFALGVITITSGANAGISRTVKVHQAGGQISALQPWPFPVDIGTSFSVAPGCDKSEATCVAKYGNKPRFRAEPFVPVADTVV